MPATIWILSLDGVPSYVPSVIPYNEERIR